MSWQAADRTQTADPAVGLLRRTRLEGSSAVGWWPTVGFVPAASRSSAELSDRSRQEPVLLLRCGRGGDVIRLAELYHSVRFAEAMALLRHWNGLGSLLPDVANFYQLHLHRHAEAAAYLMQRGLQAEVTEELRIGYAPGRCLRAWLTSLGYPLAALQQACLVNIEGYDTLSHRIVFPLEGNLYGRSIGAAVPHRFLAGGKGGLYGWSKVRHYPEIILVEGLFDLAVPWQAGFHNVTCALGTHLNALQSPPVVC